MAKISKLKNGLNFVHIPMLGTKAVTVLVLFPVGSRFEDKNMNLGNPVGCWTDDLIVEPKLVTPPSLQLVLKLRSNFINKRFLGCN